MWMERWVNPLSPNIHIQILQTDLHTFPLRITWENLIKDHVIFPLVIMLLILITIPLDNVWILLGENCFLSLLARKVLRLVSVEEDSLWFWEMCVSKAQSFAAVSVKWERLAKGAFHFKATVVSFTIEGFFFTIRSWFEGVLKKVWVFENWNCCQCWHHLSI